MISDYNEILQKIEKYRVQGLLFRQKRALFEQLHALYRELQDSYLDLYELYLDDWNNFFIVEPKDGAVLEFRQKLADLHQKQSIIRTEIGLTRQQIEELQKKNSGWVVWNEGK